MVLITFGRPRRDQEQRLIQRARSLGPNHAFPGHSRHFPPFAKNFRFPFWRVIDQSIIVGKGKADFAKAKALLKRWSHFQLKWALVDSDTPIRPHHVYCNLTKILTLWVANPLSIEFVEESDKTPDGGTSFMYGTTALKGHVLSGEERFSLDWNPRTDAVTYEILSFSRPGHLVSAVGYPLVLFLQTRFVRQSLQLLKAKMQERDPDIH